MFGAVSIFQGDAAGGLTQLNDLARRCGKVGKKTRYALTEHVIGSAYLQMAAGGDSSGEEIVVLAENAADHLNKAMEVAQEIGAKGLLGDAAF